MSWILARLAEPSTHAGIAAILFAIGTFYPPAAPITTILAGLFGGVSVVKAEPKAS